MPCWKITTGQPPAGGVPPDGEFALGTVTSSGIALFATSAGTGLKRVRLRSLSGSVSGAGGAAAAVQARRNTLESVLIPPGLCAVGMYE